MNTIVLNNVSVFTTSQEISYLLSVEGILNASNIVDVTNNSYSKTVVIQVHYWHDTEQAYHTIKSLNYRGKTNIETINGIFEAKTAEQEVDVIPDIKCEELDAYLEQMSEEDEAIWMQKYNKVSSDDEMSRDESYLYFDLHDLIGVVE
jgi:hypothetical protein|uniref:Uncharacterized protein n=1 Tax=viral metagenome TaxID=1070528 RepID=A0A6C0INZ7_9ZZZZ